MALDRSKEKKAPLILFYSYAHTDELLRAELAKHLSSLQHQGTITGWHDRKIGPGSYWATDINTYLNLASIILLLVSPDFLASNYCYSVEMHQALKRHENGEAHVIPIILRPVYWQNTPLGHLQALPRNGKPITIWGNQDEAFLDVVRGIEGVVNQIQTQPSLILHPQASSEGEQSTETPLDTDHWEEGGALSEHVGLLVQNKEWAQAEAAARHITDSQKRSLVLHKLVNALVRSEQWERAESVARSIETQQYKQQALSKLAQSLAKAQQWDRAINVTYAIDPSFEKARLLRQISRTIVGDEKRRSQALYLAYEVEEASVIKIPTGIEKVERAKTGEILTPDIKSSKRGLESGLSLIAAVLVLSLLLSLLLLPKTFTGVLYFLLWGVVGIIAVYILIRIVAFIRDG